MNTLTDKMSFQMPNMMSNMMMSNHLMSKFNNYGSTNSSNIFSESYVSETMSMIVQVFVVSFFTAFSAYCASSMEHLKHIFSETIKRCIKLLLYPIFNIYYHLIKKIYGDQTKYKIIRTCSQYTSELIRNSELFDIIQWYVNSDKCEKINKTTTPETSKEIYYQNSNKYINNFSEQNIGNIKFCIGTTYGISILIKFDNHEISCSKEKQEIEIKGELQTEKRDNICYYFETHDVDQKSNIIERLFQKAITEYNISKKDWSQKIYNNNGKEWGNGQSISSPSSLKSVVMRNDMKETLTNSIEFFLSNTEFYIENGLRRKLVIANMGPPGTGKTTTAITIANQHKMDVYSLNLENSNNGDLKYLIDKIDTKYGILLIDDFDHYYNNLDTQKSSEEQNPQVGCPQQYPQQGLPLEFQQGFPQQQAYPQYLGDKNKPPKKDSISYHELLTVFDGTGTKDGLIIFLNLNDPSKIFKSTNIEDMALFRDRRVNLLLTYEYCDHAMIKELYSNIFKLEPDMDLINKIKEDYYAPCEIVQQFIEIYEKYSKNIASKQKEIDKVLIDLAEQKIKTSRYKIKKYLKKLEIYNKEKMH